MMTVNELIEKLEKIKEKYGGNIEVVMNSDKDVSIKHVFYTEYGLYPWDKNIEVKLTDSKRYIDYIVRGCYNVKEEIIR